MTFFFRILYIGVAVYFMLNGYLAFAIISLVISAIFTNTANKDDRIIKIRDGQDVDHYISTKYIIKMIRHDGKAAKIYYINNDEYNIGEKKWDEIRKIFKIKEPFKEWKK